MTDHNNDPVFLAMQDALKGKVEPPVPPTPPEPPAPPVPPVPPADEPPVPPTPPEPPAPPVPPVPPVNEPVVVTDELINKFFEEKTGGKYKSFEDIKKDLDAPKTSFANDTIKQLNDLAAKGIDVTSRDFLDAQNLDVDKLERVDDILFEKFKRSDDGKGLSEEAIRFQINKKYDVDAWKNKADEELTPEDKFNQEMMLRDGGMAKDWLKTYKADRTLGPQVDPVKAEAEKQAVAENLRKYEAEIDNIAKSFTKISIPLKDKDGKDAGSFDYEFPEQDRKEIIDMMKTLPKDINAFWKYFTKQGADGKIEQDHQALVEMMLLRKNFNKALALASLDAAEKKAIEIERAAKNINFGGTQSSEPGKPVFKNVQEAMAHAVQNTKP